MISYLLHLGQRLHDQVSISNILLILKFMAKCRICAAPVLLAITTYERHTADMPGSTFYDRVSHAAEKLIDSLPRRLRRMSE